MCVCVKEIYTSVSLTHLALMTLDREGEELHVLDQVHIHLTHTHTHTVVVNVLPVRLKLSVDVDI